MEKEIVGIDTGNHDVKSSATTIPSGYTAYEKRPEMASDILFVNGTYYAPSIQRFKIETDKTQDEHFFILTLISMAKEIICNINACSHDDRKRMQEEISKIKEVYLGVGLPPAHMENLKASFEQYYIDNFQRIGNTFIYDDYEFNFKLKAVYVLPQDYAAIIDNKKALEIASKFPSYYGIDIGGGTFDVVPIINGKVDKENCISRPLGIIPMYEKIVNKVINKVNFQLDNQLIENVLKGEATILDDSVKQLICKVTEDWVKDALNTCIQAGIRIDMRPCVVLGGGSIILKDYIINAGILKKYEFIDNPRANAIAYKHLVKAIVG